MKKILYSLAFILMAFIVSAESLIPIDTTISVDFDGERDFRLVLPNGYEKHYYWGEGEIHADSTFNHTIYTTINQTWCSEYNTLSNLMGGIIDTCENQINNTERIILEKAEAQRDMAIYESMLNTCEDSRKEIRNESGERKINLEDCEGKLKQKSDRVVSLTQASKDNTVCQTSLQETLKSKSSTNILFLIAGLGLGWFLWKRQKNDGPSEQVEVGSIGDITTSRNSNEGPKD